MFKIYQTGRMLGTAAVAMMLLITACASAPPAPTASLNEAKHAIEVAEGADAGHFANEDLYEARQKLMSADKAVMTEDMVQAYRYAEQSTVSAQLATAKTEAAKAQAVNAEMKRGVDALIEEMQRAGEKR
jgi:type IV pilus biogenesis protein CpaD/CtpE